VERLADLVDDGILNSEIIHVESEHSAMSACIGASAAGSRVFTASCSQGLALMNEMLFVAAGLRLPIVMVNVNRALSSPINIWCFTKEAEVLMSDLTYKPISNIKKGEIVLGKDKKGNLVFTKVNKTFKHETNQLVKLKTDKFNLTCTPNHKFYYHTIHDHWIESKSLKNKNLHWFGYGYEINKDFKKGWLAGVADGDGCFFKDKQNRFSFILKVKDEELVKTFVNWANSFGFQIREVDYHKKRGYSTAILTKNKETTKLQRFLIKVNNLDFCRGYLAGIYDAEGSGPFKCKQAVIYNSNKSIVELIANYLDNLNISFKIYLDKREKGLPNYHIKINNVPEFFIKCRPILERKRKNLLWTTLKSVKSRLRIDDIQIVNKREKVYNLETETNNYIVNGFLVHNCDQQDSISARDSGWIQLYVESTQEAYDTVFQAYKIAESLNLPVMVCLDGFILSHIYEPFESIENIKKFLPEFKPKFKLDPIKPITIGPVATPEHYMEIRESLHNDLLKSKEVIKKVNLEFNKIYKRKYGDGLIEIVNPKAKTFFLAAGTVCGTIREFINDKNIGLIKLKCFRPFPAEELRKATKNIKNLIIIDKNISLGQEGTFYSEIRDALYDSKVKIQSCVAGLGGRDITLKHLQDALRGKKWLK